MVKKVISTLLIVILACFAASIKTFASFEKINYQNNKFGIHLAVPGNEDLEDAADLVNSSGGDWGYVTLVMEEGDRNKDKWQGVFDLCRQLHLIPIIRLATSAEGENWRRPRIEQAKEWAEFLDSLNWVIKNRYLVLFNEPNHGQEWGGQADPQDYALIAFEFAKILKETNADFFVMLAGFDAAAPQKPPLYFDEKIFLQIVLVNKPQIFEYIDGWSSHSYPNHGYVGSPTGSGRNSIKTYLWELDLLKSLGVQKDLPVFITETGWPHAEGLNEERSYFSAEAATKNFQTYFEQLINDEQVIAITPFILNYQGDLFDHFSWRKPGEPKEFYPQHGQVLGISKTKGEPEQEQKLVIVSQLPEKLIANSKNKVKIEILNEGQGIWAWRDGYYLELVGETKDKVKYSFDVFDEVMPFKKQTIFANIEVGEEKEGLELFLAIVKDDKVVTNQIDWPFKTVSQWSFNGIIIRVRNLLGKF
ncbi:cellulase family glycosylhydrolase [Candidatus Microgenomates bacterium]|nr:cellulase family glycosylhydrolase [Candidatus Microgenomates bacterium]